MRNQLLPSRSRGKSNATRLRPSLVALAGCLPAVCPPRAHRGRRAILQLQRRQQVWHQVTREQHSLARPLRQRLVRCEDGVGLILDLGRRLPPGGRDLQELRVRRGAPPGARRAILRAAQVVPARRVGGWLKRAGPLEIHTLVKHAHRHTFSDTHLRSEPRHLRSTKGIWSL